MKAILILISMTAMRAEVHTMTLKEAVALAMKQNPDIVMSRFDEDKARLAVRVAKDPFYPHLGAGSGLAKTSGFPMSVEGSAPTIIQAKITESIFNRPQMYTVAQAKEDARGAALSVTAKRDEVAFRVASLYLEAERAARLGEFASRDVESQQKVLETVQSQIREGRALPLAEKTAAYHIAAARQVAATLTDDQATAETSLAIALGFPAEDRVRPAAEERTAPALPASEEQAVQSAVESNRDMRRLQSQVASKRLESRGAKAAWLPRIDLIAQYGMLAKFNNYDEFFRKFQRNNWEIGMSFQIPLWNGPAPKAQAAQAESEMGKLQVQMASTRNKLASDLQQSFRDARRSESAAEVARLDLEVAREQLSVTLAQMQEGRTTLSQVEEARVIENQKWVAFYDAQYARERARWNVLRLTGTLATVLQ